MFVPCPPLATPPKLTLAPDRYMVKLSRELAEEKITVLMLHPGWVKTEMVSPAHLVLSLRQSGSVADAPPVLASRRERPTRRSRSLTPSAEREHNPPLNALFKQAANIARANPQAQDAALQDGCRLGHLLGLGGQRGALVDSPPGRALIASLPEHKRIATVSELKLLACGRALTDASAIGSEPGTAACLTREGRAKRCPGRVMAPRMA